MDERTLNDLLECSVCLERLDISSKALPCQHTFCRKCLEVIYESYRELRCPECRLLVESKIDDLPTNVLLMRILEGMKNTVSTINKTLPDSHEHINTHKVPNNSFSSERWPHLKLKYQEKKKNQNHNDQNNASRQQQYDISNVRTYATHLTMPHAYAIHDFESINSSNLQFKKGDFIMLKKKIDDNWFLGQKADVEGTFPCNYVQIVVPLPSPPPQCTALYDFKMGPNEEEGCLSFKKGTVINVLRRIDHNWLEGRIGSSIGIFPIEFVQLNSSAKKLLDGSKYLDNNAEMPCLTKKTYTSLSTTTVDSTLNNNTATTLTGRALPNKEALISSNRLAATICCKALNYNTIRNKNRNEDFPISFDVHNSQGIMPSKSLNISGPLHLQNKRHSLNTFLKQENSALNLTQSNRHSAEILNIPSNLFNQPSTSSAISGIPNGSSQMTTINKSHSSLIQKSQNKMHQSSANKTPQSYIALYAYKPRKVDELELIKGYVYVVIESCLDGWFKGINCEGACGMFPGNYVTPIKYKDQQPSIAPTNTQSVSTVPCSVTPFVEGKFLENVEGNNKPPDLPPRYLTHTKTNVTPIAGNISIQGYKGKTMLKEESTGCIANFTSSFSPSLSSQSSSSTSNNMKKFLIHIKARSQSPTSAAPQHHSNNKQKSINTKVTAIQKNTQHTNNIPSAVHIRSGSCPSQWVPYVSKQSSMMGESFSETRQVQSKPQMEIKSNEANKMIPCKNESSRPSIDSTLRSIYTHQMQLKQNPPHCKSHSLDASIVSLHGSVLPSFTTSSSITDKQFIAPRNQVKISNTNNETVNTQNNLNDR